MNNGMEAEAMATMTSKAGKYLTFLMGKEVYGIEILKVQEIIGMMPVTRVPKTPDFVRGVINLRGKVIPVIELRRKFGMEAREDTERTCIVVVQVAWSAGTVIMGMLVDEVSEVLNVTHGQIEAPPSFGKSEAAQPAPVKRGFQTEPGIHYVRDAKFAANPSVPR